MFIFCLCSAEQLIDRQKTTAKRRRRNQNAEIDELAKLLPLKQVPLSLQNVEGAAAMEFDGLGGTIDQSKQQPVDKISVLRIVSTFLRFQDFVKKGILREFTSLCYSVFVQIGVNVAIDVLISDPWDNKTTALYGHFFRH